MADEYGAYKDKANPDNEWTFRAAVIRFGSGTVNSDGTFSSGGPYIHANAAHIAVGVQSVHVEADGDLVIDLDGGPISAILLTPDETLTTRGIWGGPSGEASNTTIRFYKDGVGRLDLSTQSGWNAIAGSLNNLWCFWATCTTRGTGQPSKADRVLTQIADLQAVVAGQATTIATLSEQVAWLMGLQTPGSFARFDQAKQGQNLAALDAEHAGDTFAEFDAAYEQV